MNDRRRERIIPRQGVVAIRPNRLTMEGGELIRSELIWAELIRTN